MKKLFLVQGLLLCVFFGLSFNSFAADNWTGRISFLVGEKNLLSDHWIETESHLEQGAICDFAKQSSPVAITITFARSKHELLLHDEFYWPDVMDFEIDVTAKKLGLGIRYIMRKEKRFRPYLSCGMLSNTSEGKATHPRTGAVAKDNYTDINIQIGTGFYTAITKHFYWGLDLNLSFEKTELFYSKLNHGATNAAILIGYQF